MGHKAAGFPGVAPGTRCGARAGCDSGRARGGRDTVTRRHGALRVRRPRLSGLGIPPARSPARPTRSYVRKVPPHTRG